MFLKQSTASQEILLGPFLDDTDGKTAETGLTIANTDIKLWKSGGTTESDKNSGGATHIASGRYYAVLDATDTNTVGLLEVSVSVSGALPVRRQFYVLEEAVYDALFGASSAGYQVPIWSSASATVNLSGTTVKTATDVEIDTQDIQSRLPAALVSGRMDSSVGAMASSVLTAAALATDAAGEIADAVWDEPYSQHTTAGSFGKLLDTIRKANLTIDGTVSNAITPTTTTFASDVVAVTSAYAHAVLLFVSGPLEGENSPIISYNSTNGVFVLEEPLTTAPSNGDEFVVIAGSHVHDIASIQSGLATTTQLTTVEGKIDAIDGVTDKLDTTLELDGVVYRFTTNALEQAPAGGGGGSTVIVSPLSAQSPERVVGTTITTYVGDLSPVTIEVYDADDDPVDLSAQGNLEVCIESRDNVDLQVIAHASITISGSSSNKATWTPNSSAVAIVDKHRWSLRTATGKKVLAYGPWIVARAALNDA